MKLDVTKKAKPNETIEEHTNEVVAVGEQLLHTFELVLKNSAQKLEDDFFITQNRTLETKEFILELLKYHDYGKINPFFQEHICQLKKHSTEKRRHAEYSFYIWLIDQKQKQLSEKTLFFRAVIAYACIKGHHSKLQEFFTFLEEDARILKEEIDQLAFLEILEKEDFTYLLKCFSSFKKMNLQTSVYTLFFCKFAFSILITSDSVASSEFSPEEYENVVSSLFGRTIQKTEFHEKLNGNPMIQSVSKQPFNEKTLFKDQPDLNSLRQLLQYKCKQSYNSDTSVYILEAPVGTGKTISSLCLADEIVKKEDKRKIISVFPLNSVQAQYVETLTNQLKFQTDWINVVNSDSIFGLDNKNDKSDEKGFSLNKQTLWLFERDCFAQELLVTSHVRFFQTVSGVKRKSALSFLNLTNAVVVLDEFQNYPPKYWFSIWDELLMLSEMMGVKWVFTTGTFPVSQNQLTTSFPTQIKKVLTENENKELFGSPYVKNRCTITPLDEIATTYEKDEFTTLAKLIEEDIKVQEETIGHTQFIVCVNFVKHAKALYEELSRSLEDYTCYFLCGRHSTSYKRALMNRIQKHHKNPKEKVLLVTTKTVECGMDFDFDGGYKEFDMFDSVEQLSGRVNRSNKKESCFVKTFQLQRKQMEQEKLYPYNEDVLRFLNEKAFIALYEILYENNRVTLENEKKPLKEMSSKLQFKKYAKALTIIEEQDYITGIYLVQEKEKENFHEKMKRPNESLSYSENRIYSMELSKKLEPYYMTVTTKWLGAQKKEGRLIEEEKQGITYYTVKEEEVSSCLDLYELDGITTYIEKESNEKKSTFEFY